MGMAMSIDVTSFFSSGMGSTAGAGAGEDGLGFGRRRKSDQRCGESSESAEKTVMPSSGSDSGGGVGLGGASRGARENEIGYDERRMMISMRTRERMSKR